MIAIERFFQKMDFICKNNNSCCDIDINLAVLTVVKLLRETSTIKEHTHDNG